MKKYLIKTHSNVDLITNSSSVIFTIDNDLGEYTIREMLEIKAEENGDLEWFKDEVTISTNPDGSIQIYSFLNDPDWLRDFIENTFNVVDTWHGG